MVEADMKPKQPSRVELIVEIEGDDNSGFRGVTLSAIVLFYPGRTATGPTLIGPGDPAEDGDWEFDGFWLEQGQYRTEITEPEIYRYYGQEVLDKFNTLADEQY